MQLSVQLAQTTESSGPGLDETLSCVNLRRRWHVLIQEINEFLTHLTKWLTRVANEPEQKLNLLLERTYGNGPDAELDLNVVARFFKRGAGYDALASTLTAEQFAVLANQTGSTPTDSRR